MAVQVKNFLKARHDRAVGTILGYAEREVIFADEDHWQDFRSIVLGAIDAYHDAVLDLVKSEGNGEMRNEEIVSLLEEIHSAVRTPVRS